MSTKLVKSGSSMSSLAQARRKVRQQTQSDDGQSYDGENDDDDPSKGVNTDVAQVFGRGTSVGRLLHSIYNPKNTYKPKVRVRVKENAPSPHSEHTQKRREELLRLKEKTRPKIEVPKPKPKNFKPAPKPKQFFDAGMGRKPQTRIAEELEQHREEQRSQLRRAGSGNVGRHTREIEKQRLQSHFEDAKVTDEANPHAPVLPSAGRGRTSSRKEYTPVRPGRMAPPPVQPDKNQRLFDQIQQEIEERKDFLQHMREAGQAHKYEKALTREIAERVEQLKIVHDIIESGHADS